MKIRIGIAYASKRDQDRKWRFTHNQKFPSARIDG